MRWSPNRSAALVLLSALTGCASMHHASTQPVAAAPDITAPPSVPLVIVPSEPTTQPVATSDLGSGTTGADLTPKPKPFIAIPKIFTSARTSGTTGGRPSTLLLEHASPDSPVPLSEYSNQPSYTVVAFDLHANLSQKDLESRLGKPAQIADTVDPWLVYRLVGNREIWLHFSGEDHDHLDAADVIRGAEDGYVRDRVFSADD